MRAVSDLRDRIDSLAALMAEFGLAEAELTGDGWRVGFRKQAARSVELAMPGAVAAEPVEAAPEEAPEPATEPAPPEPPSGTPVNSPMTGIYYSSPSPSAPPFVQSGDVVEAGQVVGLIEAMKVFNEITAPLSGTVTRIAAQNGQLVQPGEPLLFIA